MQRQVDAAARQGCMKRTVWVLLAGMLLAACSAVSGPVEPPAAGQSLRALADERGMLVGAAVKADQLFEDSEYMQTVQYAFNLIVVEWELNFYSINPEPGQYNFYRVDPVFDFAEENDLLIHANTLLWYREIPAWFAEGDFTREESIEIMREHITTLVGRYKGRAYAWDVVNEAFTDDGELRESIWLERIGPDYIELAYQFAHEADPDALLFYNDYGAEEPNAKSDAIYEMAADFRARGVPLDGVGFQMHLSLLGRRNPRRVAENMARFDELGLKVYVSEMDVRTTRAIGTQQQRLDVQAKLYSDMFGVCVAAPNCDMFVVWGVADHHSYLYREDPNDMPLLFDRSYEPKPAYYALIEVLNGTLQGEVE